MKLLNWIKTYKNLITYTVLIIIGIIMLIYVKKIGAENKKLKQELTLVKIQKRGTLIEKEKEFKDSQGSVHTVIDKEANTISEHVLEEGTAISIGLLDTVSEALKISKDKINQITKINYTLSNKNFILEKKVDSLTRHIYYSYNGKYLKFNQRDSADTRIGNYIYNGDITYTDYHKKKIPLIGRTFNYTDIYSSDTSFRINSVQRLTIEHQPRSWGFALEPSLLYNVTNPSLYFGAKAQLSFKDFTISGARYYNIQGLSPVDILGVSYPLIKY